MEGLERRQRVREPPMALAGAVLAIAATVVWWFSRSVDGAGIIARVNAYYASVAGYDADIFESTNESPLKEILKRHAVIVGGRLCEMPEESAHPSNGRALHTFVDASLHAGMIDGRTCWTKLPTSAEVISREIGIGQPMFLPTERVVSARTGGHGYLIETTAQSGLGQSVATTWDIDGDTLGVRSRTTHPYPNYASRMTITRDLCAPADPPSLQPRAPLVACTA